MEGKSSAQMVRLFTRCLPIAFTLNDIGQFLSRLGKNLKTLKCSSGHIECSFDNPAKIFGQKSESLLPKSGNNLKIIILPEKKFLNVFLWTRRMQF